jgi:hypothetical protein
LADERSKRCAAPHLSHSRSPEGHAGAPGSPFRRVLPATLVVLAGLTSVAYAVEPNASGRSEALFFAQLGLLLLIGRGLGEIMQKLGQPAVMGQLLGGVLLGPSVLGLVWPDFQHTLFPGTPSRKA